MKRVHSGVRWTLLLNAVLLAAACGGDRPEPTAQPSPPPAAPRIEVDSRGGTGRRGPGDLYNGCERIWCVTHERNYALDHFLSGHVGWILHDDGHGDVFLPRDRTGGTAFPHARAAVLRLCGRHLHPFFLGATGGALKKTGYNLALGYDRAHFTQYGTRIPNCCLNEQGWGFLHVAVPKEFRFGDRTSASEMAGSGWQKAFAAQPAPR